MFGQGLGHGQGVVAHGGEVLGQVREQAGAGVADAGEVAVAGAGCGVHVGAGQVGDGLVAQAYAQDGQVGAGQEVGYLAQVAGVLGPAGAG
ncbi:hypothetical protein GCM10007147_10710 [Nocardiopsis kunsanensis]|uniref:Uncharacterized protein n=1 Tax=Nocardiopsis kunsanensis TaxID=141693 RepID=A0A918XAK7_9ACTN|nr:hypothetical protein GCM10007147_10710 [Nocardiopsis kunsanensis]